MNHDTTDRLTQVAGAPAQPVGSRNFLARNVALAALGALFLAVIGLYWHATSVAVTVWYDSRAYNHGFLILPIVIYLVWERRHLLHGLAPQPYPPALLLLIPTGLAWLVAHIVAVTEGEQLALYLSIQALLLGILGRPIYCTLLFPFLYLFFLVPTGDFLVPYLQNVTAWFLVAGLRLTGIPVFWDGVFVSIPTGNFEVAEACAGLRFLTATVAYGLLFADFAYTSLIKKLIFFVLCLVTPIIANGIRAYGIVLIAYLSNNELATGVDHIVYGWIFFSMVTLALTAIGMTFRDKQPAPALSRGRAPTGPGSATGVVVTACLGLLLLALPRAYAAYVEYRVPVRGDHVLTLPIAAAPWIQQDDAAVDWRPELEGVDSQAQRRFRNGPAAVDLFVGYYASQDADHKLIKSGNHLADPTGWTMASWSPGSLKIAGETVPVSLSRVRGQGGQRLVATFYWVDGRFEPGTFAAKLLQARAEIGDHRSAAAGIAISTDDSTGEGMSHMEDFLGHLGSLKDVLEREAGR